MAKSTIALLIIYVLCVPTFVHSDAQVAGGSGNSAALESLPTPWGEPPSTRLQPSALADSARLGILAPQNSSESDPSATFSSNGVQGISATIDGKSYSLPQTFSWTAGTQHNVSVSSMAYPATATRVIFTGWSGYRTSKNPQLSIVVNADVNLTANYRTEFLETLRFTTADGLRVYPSSVTLLGPSGKNISLSGGGPIWMNASSKYSLVGAVWSSVAIAPAGGSAATIVSSSPSEIVVPLAIYRDTIRVVDVFGLPFKGVSVTVAGANGSEVTKLTDGNGVVSMELPFGYYTATVLYFGFKVSLRDQSVGPSTTTVTLPVNYPTVLALGVSAGAYLSYVMRRRVKKWIQEAAPFKVDDSTGSP